MKTDNQTTKLFRSIGLALGVGFLFFFFWSWQMCIVENFSPTGLYRHMPHVYDIWICLFLDVFWLALGIIMTFLVTCYPFISGD